MKIPWSQRGPGPTWLVLCASFFASGAAALTYQVCWQRALYGAVGIDMDSITLIVSCFMLGVGIGGALGGMLADAMPGHLVKAYAAAECLLAIFGVFSLAIVQGVSHAIVGEGQGGLAITGAAVFLVLVIPTTLMGATLPLLTMAFDKVLKNVGQSVGTLYFWNTLGAAFAAWVWPFVLFDRFTLDQAVLAAAGCNMAAALIALTLSRAQPTRA